ncbi:hypothetical protein ACROYT_G015518 [Oculina patagonica]
MEIKKLYSNNMQKSLTTCDLLVADTAKAITIVLWEDQIEQVEKDGCYFFKQVCLLNHPSFFSGCCLYSSDIPRYLHDRPYPFIDHCMDMRDAANNSLLRPMPSSTVVGAFTVSKRNGKCTNEVFMEDDTSLPRCMCKEFKRMKWLCKHTFANSYRPITTHERDIIIHAKRSLLFSDNIPWEKKASNDQFDVIMGSFDGAETYELVGCYILSCLTQK